MVGKHESRTWPLSSYFWSSYEYLIQFQSEIIVLVKWSYRSPPTPLIMLIIEPKLVIIF